MARHLQLITPKRNMQVEVKKLNTNEQFLKAFMRNVDLQIFTPSIFSFFSDFLSIERVRKYGERYVISTFIPPFPGKAFDRFMGTFFGSDGHSPVQAVDLAVTNGCIFNCRHCYNAGRVIADPTTRQLRSLVAELQEQGAFVINFTGGEPCLRRDLPEICEELHDDTSAIISTTGYGFTDELAGALRERGVYGISISLDSADEQEHDRKRGAKGAYKIALNGIETALKHGFYTYTCVVPSKATLDEANFSRLVEMNHSLGVYEIQILEPAPAGKLLHSSQLLEEEDFETILRYMAELNSKDNGPAISSFAHLESPEFFGCGAGFSHIYIDGSGEVSPCNMMPVTFGNAYTGDLKAIIERMQDALKRPCRMCRAYAQREYFQANAGRGHLIPEWESTNMPLYDDGLPRFYELISGADNEITGNDEIVSGYSKASETYNDYWLSVASGPIEEMFQQLKAGPGVTALDCGCGTGYTTARLANMIGSEGRLTGIDLTAEMVEKAKKRFSGHGMARPQFRIGDVLTELGRIEPGSIDVATLTWLIGYVGCDEVFPQLAKAMKPGGMIGLVAHLDRSPELPFGVFEDLVRENPGVMDKAVRMKFPLNDDDLRKALNSAGFKIEFLKSGTFSVFCHTGREVFDHVMKSGAGTTFYYAVKESARQQMKISEHLGEFPLCIVMLSVQLSGSDYRSAIRLTVSIGITGHITSDEHIVDNPYRVGNVTRAVAIAIARFYRIGRIASDEDIIDYMHCIADIYVLITIGISA
jgi:MoaA/NifB/PqqE/SkfB family radical SAM enzyme/ubiquinone/menaquinone biosynthesis C-methylase UbiE